MPEWKQEILKRLSGLKLAPTREAEIAEELAQHLEDRYQELLASGATEAEARHLALEELGDPLADKWRQPITDELARGLKRVEHEAAQEPIVPGGGGSSNFLAPLWQDIRYGLRMLRKNPGFTLVAVLTLALGIGANTAIFSVIYALLLRPLAYANPQQLVRLFEDKKQEGIADDGTSYPDFEAWRRQNHAFSGLAGYQVHDLTLTGRGDPAAVRTIVVTPELFSVLGAQPLAGRAFIREEGRKGAAPVAVLSENLWRGRFGSDPNIVGRSINLDKRAFTVVGIMPATFRFPLSENAQNLWIPLAQDPLFSGWMSRPGGHWLSVVGRLKPGVSLAQAQAEMDSVSARLAQEFPAEDTGWTAHLVPLHQEIVGNVKSALLALMGAVGFVLLIACVNIANLLLTRATSRSGEIAVRRAMGAGRARLVRQSLTESALLGLLGGGAGVLVAYAGVQGLTALLPPGLPPVHAIQLDGWVVAFALLLSGIAGLVSGVAPAFFWAGSSLTANLKETRATSGSGRERLRKTLAVTEVALAMLLLVGAGLLIRSFAALTSVNPGFEAEHLLKAEVSLPQFQYSKPQQWTEFSDELLERLRAQPGMKDTAAAVPLPLADGFVNLSFDIAGVPPVPGVARDADYVAVSPNYFRVMGIPLMRGRTFSREDAPSAPRVAVISEALARLYFPNQDPIGKNLIFGFPPNGAAPREIVGVVGDVRDVSLGRTPGPMMYVPFNQAPFWGVVLVVKTDLSTESAANVIRQEVKNMDKDLPVTDFASMPEILEASVAQPRFRTLLFSLFGALALALAAVGIFGMISYSVASRTREIGIRMALGAEKGKVLRMVVGQGLTLIILGVSIGTLGAFGLARFLSSLLYGVKPTDPLTFTLVSLILIVVALLACYIPARRATQVDPVVALRYE
jgi:putative ABC transport system permease protein